MIPGTVPIPSRFPTSCRFAGRCPYAQEACSAAPIPLEHLDDGRVVRCIRHRELVMEARP
jgi:oligopeptide/dipeptide ABC transporter ATP-binding protein